MVKVVLVDKNDKVLGYKEKFEAHKNPVPLHRAISVVIFSPDRKRMLLQRRASGKPTWPFFWSNACCTHPLPGEDYKAAAQRRLKEEMGISTKLREISRFVYKAKYNKTWGEHELDVVFEGVYEGQINPNLSEVSDYKWILLNDLKKEIKENFNKYTPWFKLIFKRLYNATHNEFSS